MKIKEISEDLNIKLVYLVGKADPSKGYYPGGVKDPDHLGEMSIWVQQTKRFHEEAEGFVENDEYRINIKGTRSSLFELGRYLIALSRYQSEDRNYHDHISEFTQVENAIPCEVVIHGPVD